MSDAQAPRPRYKSDLIYGLEDHPHFTAAIFSALQQVLASFVGIITPTLIVGGVLGLVAGPRRYDGVAPGAVDRRGQPLRGVLYRRLTGAAGAPMIGAVLQLMPKPVLGGATLIMFGTVAVAGIKILAEAGLHRRNMLIVAISLGMGLGVAAVPEVLRDLPKALHNIFESPITVGAFCAILLNIFLPEEFIALEEDEFDPESSTLKVMQDPDVTK